MDERSKSHDDSRQKRPRPSVLDADARKLEERRAAGKRHKRRERQLGDRMRNAATGDFPHREPIQRSFGAFDISRMRATLGLGPDQEHLLQGARGLASGHVAAFRGAPDLHTAAHEAAHLVQQSGRPQPEMQAKSDPSTQKAGGATANARPAPGAQSARDEQHADRVADAVVQGRSAEKLLREVAAPGPIQVDPARVGGQIQRKSDDAPSPAPTHGHSPGPDRPHTGGDNQPAPPHRTFVIQVGPQQRPVEIPRALLPKPDASQPERAKAEALLQRWRVAMQSGISSALNAKSQYLRRHPNPSNMREVQLEMFKAMIVTIRPIAQQMKAIKHPGCDAMSDLVASMCRMVGIDAEMRTKPSGHRYPFLPRLNVGLKDGDDLYTQKLANVRADKLILTGDQIARYIGAETQMDNQATVQFERFVQRPTQPMIEAQQLVLAALRSQLADLPLRGQNNSVRVPLSELIEKVPAVCLYLHYWNRTRPYRLETLRTKHLRPVLDEIRSAARTQPRTRSEAVNRVQEGLRARQLIAGRQSFSALKMSELERLEQELHR